MTAITTTTPITPNHTPALKMPSIAWQLLKEKAIASMINSIVVKLNLYIIINLYGRFCVLLSMFSQESL